MLHIRENQKSNLNALIGSTMPYLRVLPAGAHGVAARGADRARRRLHQVVAESDEVGVGGARHRAVQVV